MGGSSSEKKQLGKIMLQQRLVSAGELEEMLAEQRRDGSRLASSAARRGRLSMADALGALAEQHGMPAVDLTTQIVPLALLKLIPRELAEERAVLPFGQDGDKLLLAMASPGERETVEELEFVAGKSVAPHVALHHVLRTAIGYAYDRLEAGGEYYVGAYVTEAALSERGLPDLQRAPEPAAPDAEPDAEADARAAAEAPELPEHVPPELDHRDLAAHAPAQPLTNDELPEATPPADATADAAGEQGVLEPLDAAFGERTVASKPPVIPTHDANARVLIVDGSESLRESLRRLLQETGISVFEATDVATALTQVGAHEPRVLVVNPELPTLHGLELCRRLRESDVQIPIVVVTDHGGWRMRQDLKEAFGVRHVFRKPLDLIKLTQTVRLVLEGQEVSTDPPPLRAETEARWNAGMTAFERGDLEAAIAELEAGVQLDRDAFELQYHLALLYGQREDLFAAMAALEIAVSLQPMHFSALKNLAVIYQRAGFRHQALDTWERVLEAAPDPDTRAHIRDHMVALLS